MATEADKTNNGVIGTIVAVGAFAMIAVSVAVTAMVRAQLRDLDDERSTHADLETVRALKSTQRSALAQEPHWADRSKGLAAIPLERAMALVKQEIAQNPRRATPVMPSAKKEADGGAPAPTSASGGAPSTEGNGGSAGGH